MGSKPKQPVFDTNSLEEKILALKYFRIGWAISNMNWFERLLWTITGKHQYMTYDFWEQENDQD